jgi:hypothetical protein
LHYSSSILISLAADVEESSFTFVSLILQEKIDSFHLYLLALWLIFMDFLASHCVKLGTGGQIYTVNAKSYCCALSFSALMELLLATLEKKFITVFLSIRYQDRRNTTMT